jgi:hypothetical protein
MSQEMINKNKTTNSRKKETNYIDIKIFINTDERRTRVRLNELGS